MDFRKPGLVEREMGLAPLAQKWASFGWNVDEIDGHDLAQLLDVLKKPTDDAKPHAVIARTVKGKGVSFIEDDYTFHGRPLTERQAVRARKELMCT